VSIHPGDDRVGALLHGGGRVQRPGELVEGGVEALEVLALLAYEVGVDPARVHGAHAHALVGDLEPQAVGELLDRGLGGRVRGHPRRHREGGGGGDDHHVAAALGDVRQRGGDGAHDAVEVDLDRSQQHLDRRDRDGAAVADAGVGEHDVDAAERGHGAGDGAVHLGLVGDVGLEPGGALAELARERAQALRLQAHERHAGALGDDAAGGLGADAARGAGDQHDLVLESHASHITRLVPVRTVSSVSSYPEPGFRNG